MNTKDLENLLQKQLSHEINVPSELDDQVQQQINNAVAPKTNYFWFILGGIMSFTLIILEMDIILSFVNSLLIKTLFVGAHISLFCILTSYIIISSTDSTNFKRKII